METEIAFILNNQTVKTKINPAVVLLDYLRKNQKLTGTKEVCKEGDCGACAVLVGELNNGDIKYKTINSCLFPIVKVRNKHIVTIEGLNTNSLSKIQEAFLEEGASQCGFCTPGFIISFTGYLLNAEEFDLDSAINSIAGNICRCTGYHSIIRALKRTHQNIQRTDLTNLIEKGIIPEYFQEIPNRLIKLSVSVKDEMHLNDFQIISGGTDLFVQKPEIMKDCTIKLSDDIIIKEIKVDNDYLIISGNTTIEEFKDFLEQNKLNLNLKDLFRLFASLPIRNTATLAGNIVNASPIADITISILTLDTILVLRSNITDTREIMLQDFFIDYKKMDKENDEIIESIKIPVPQQNCRFNFEKVSKRTHLDIASVNSAISIVENDGIIKSASVSAGGVAPIPLLLKGFSNGLVGEKICNELLDTFNERIKNEISPISDIRGSKLYKKLLLVNLIKVHFKELFPSLISDEVFK